MPVQVKVRQSLSIAMSEGCLHTWHFHTPASCLQCLHTNALISFLHFGQGAFGRDDNKYTSSGSLCVGSHSSAPPRATADPLTRSTGSQSERGAPPAATNTSRSLAEAKLNSQRVQEVVEIVHLRPRTGTTAKDIVRADLGGETPPAQFALICKPSVR